MPFSASNNHHHDPTPAPLGRYWDRVVQGRPAAPGDLDPTLAETVRRLHARDDAPGAEAAFAARLLTTLEDRMDTLHLEMSQFGGPVRMGPQTTGSPRTPATWLGFPIPSRTGPRRLAWPLAQLASAALVVVALAFAFVTLGPPRHGGPDERLVETPALIGMEATPSPSGTDEALATVTLPAGALPSDVIGGFNYYTVLAGSEGVWDWTCCIGIRLDYVLAGSLTVRGDGPTQVLRGGGAGSWEEQAPGTEVVLDAGDALLSRMEDGFTSVNAGSAPVDLLDGVLFKGTPVDDPVPYTNGGVEAWQFQDQDLMSEPASVSGPVTVRVRQRDMAAGETLPFPAGAIAQLAVDLDEKAVLATGADFSKQNLSDAPLTVYAMTLEAGEGAATASAQGAPLALDTVFSTTLPADQVPTAGNLDYLFWRVSLEPNSRGPASAQSWSCCPGPQITHVLEGDLTLRIEGTARIFLGGEMAPGGTEIPAGAEVVLRPGDTVVFDYATPAEYANQGGQPVELVGGGIFAGAVRGSPAGTALLDHNEAYSIPALPAGPLEATLTRATLPPGGEVPGPAAGALVLDVGAFGDADIAQSADGVLRNIGVTEETIYVLTLTPLAAADGVGDSAPT